MAVPTLTALLGFFAILYKNGNEYFFRLNSLDEDKPEVRELFTSILNTVEIK